MKSKYVTCECCGKDGMLFPGKNEGWRKCDIIEYVENECTILCESMLCIECYNVITPAFFQISQKIYQRLLRERRNKLTGED